MHGKLSMQSKQITSQAKLRSHLKGNKVYSESKFEWPWNWKHGTRLPQVPCSNTEAVSQCFYWSRTNKSHKSR